MVDTQDCIGHVSHCGIIVKESNNYIYKFQSVIYVTFPLAYVMYPLLLAFPKCTLLLTTDLIPLNSLTLLDVGSI